MITFLCITGAVTIGVLASIGLVLIVAAFHKALDL